MHQNLEKECLDQLITPRKNSLFSNLHLMWKPRNFMNKKGIKSRFIHLTKVYNKFKNLEMQNKINILKEL